MLKKIVLGLLLGLSTLSISAAELTTESHENAVGYKDAKAGDRFPAALSIQTSLIGKRDSFELAFNKEKNKDAYVLIYDIDFTSKRINLGELNENSILAKDNLKFTSDADISYLKIDTNVPFMINKIQSDNYIVTYTVGNGYLYKVDIETKYQEKKYDANYDSDKQEFIMMKKTEAYLKSHDYKKIESWVYPDRKYEKGDIIVNLEQPTSFSFRSDYYLISIENKKLLDEYKQNQENNYNKEVNNSFDDFDRLLK